MSDTERYPWTARVSAFGGTKLLKIGVQNGGVVVQPPPFGDFRVDPDTADTISAMFKAAANRARDQRQANS